MKAFGFIPIPVRRSVDRHPRTRGHMGYLPLNATRNNRELVRVEVERFYLILTMFLLVDVLTITFQTETSPWGLILTFIWLAYEFITPKKVTL